MDFYDSARPGLIPAGAHAALYHDGLFTPSEEEVKRLGPVRWITVIGGAAAAANTGCADYELHNPVYSTPGALRAWAEERLKMNCRARPYFNRSDAEKAWAQLHDLPNVFPWVATLDNRRWTAEELAADLSANWHAPIPANRLWGNQFQGGVSAPFDLSTLYSAW